MAIASSSGSSCAAYAADKEESTDEGSDESEEASVCAEDSEASSRKPDEPRGEDADGDLFMINANTEASSSRVARLFARQQVSGYNLQAIFDALELQQAHKLPNTAVATLLKILNRLGRLL